MSDSEGSVRPSILHRLSELLREHMGLTKAFIMLLLAALSIGAYFLGILDGGDRAFWDACLRHRPAPYISPKIVVIEIDESSIQSVGRWPWDREWHATLIQALKDFGARAVALDMIFSEPTLAQTDDLLAKIVRNSKLVYLPIGFDEIRESRASDPIRSLQPIAQAAAGEGHTYVQPDRDGILRWVRPYLDDADGKRHWHLGLLLAASYWRTAPEEIRLERQSIEFPVAGTRPVRIPLDEKGRMLISWPGRWSETFRRTSYVNVIQAYSSVLKGKKPSVDPAIFKDAICVVGITASGLFDVYATPFEDAYPAAGTTAVVLNSLLERSLLKPVSRATHVIWMIVLSAVLLLVMLRAKNQHTLFLIGALAAGYTGLAYALFAFAGIAISLTYPLVLILSGYAALAGYHQMVIVMEKNRLLKLATTDPLTGLSNIAHFKRLLQAELESTRLRTKKDICVLMADGDHFKKVNDTYGHAAGDDVLRGLADVLRSNCRALDVAARYGGEEFIVMLPGATLEAGLKVAEKMRAGVEDRKYPLGPGHSAVSFTASFGVVAFAPGESLDDLLKRADEALYLAKKTGRNCVCTL